MDGSIQPAVAEAAEPAWKIIAAAEGKERRCLTVIDSPETSDVFVSTKGLCDDWLTVEIQGQQPDRCFEDRSVLLRYAIHKDPSSELASDTFWLLAEEAIELGQLLIKHGTYAMRANMINHQCARMLHRLETFVREERVQKLIFTMVDEHPHNYGGGFHTFNIRPEWCFDCTPEYEKTFNFDLVIYWSPFPEEFEKQQMRYGFGVPIVFENFDYAARVADFHKACEEHR